MSGGLWPERAGGDRPPWRGDDRPDSSRQAGGSGEARTPYPYVSADGEVIATKVRIERPGEKKTFYIEPRGVSVADVPLYCLPDLLRAGPEMAVLFLEGEKDCNQAAADGFVAVTTVGGAGQTDFGESLAALANGDIVLVPDHDTVGHTYMRRVREVLATIARRVRVI